MFCFVWLYKFTNPPPIWCIIQTGRIIDRILPVVAEEHVLTGRVILATHLASTHVVGHFT